MKQNQVNLITEGTKIEGTIIFDEYTRFEGTLNGTLKGTPHTLIVIGNNGIVEDKIDAEEVIIDGFVRGDIHCSKKALISHTGRVVGNIKAPNIEIQFGGYFEGQCKMEEYASRSTEEPAHV